VSIFDQEAFELRCEWGPEGVRRLAPLSDAVIIIDIFSFTTSASIAVSRGARVYPFGGDRLAAADFARTRQAIPATARRTDARGFSLAPSSLLRLQPEDAIVLPSPNGATLSLLSGQTATLAGSLRNARAAGRAAARLGRKISVIPAGERWPDGSLRPALEDQIGAGAILHELPGVRSPEAQAAEAVFLRFQADLLGALQSTPSGLEVVEIGARRDLELAAELNVSDAVPFLVKGAYQAFLW
jgi:2-phosphosulfolactate phosphatase